MDMPSPPRQPTHEEIQAIERFREKVDKFSIVEKFKNGIDGTERYSIEDGEVVIHVDDLKDRFSIFDFGNITFPDLYNLEEQEPLPYYDESVDEASLPHSETEELSNKKLYGKSEIMKLLGCRNQKALNFLKLLFQMQYAIKIGKSYMVKAEDFDRFFEDFKGQEISI